MSDGVTSMPLWSIGLDSVVVSLSFFREHTQVFRDSTKAQSPLLQPYQTFPSLSAKVAVVGTGAAPRARGAPSVRETAVSSVNLRDCGQFAVNLKQGILFRSSQVLRFVHIGTWAPGTRLTRLYSFAHLVVYMQCHRNKLFADQGK